MLYDKLEGVIDPAPPDEALARFLGEVLTRDNARAREARGEFPSAEFAAFAAAGRYDAAADVLDAYADRDVEGAVAARAAADQLRAKLN